METGEICLSDGGKKSFRFFSHFHVLVPLIFIKKTGGLYMRLLLYCSDWIKLFKNIWMLKMKVKQWIGVCHAAGSRTRTSMLAGQTSYFFVLFCLIQSTLLVYNNTLYIFDKLIITVQIILHEVWKYLSLHSICWFGTTNFVYTPSCFDNAYTT